MTSEANKLIAKNTVLLYIRMMFSMVVSLYTSRVILNTLGVEDYGVYNVVGGIVTLFSFINASLATGTQRFLTFELGNGDKVRLNRIFSMSLNIHFIIGLIVLILAETIGFWFLNFKLVIPLERIHAAKWVYQFSVLSAIISVTQVPYSASIISHERFNVYAYVGVIEVLLRLFIVFMLLIIPMDKLILLAGLGFIVSSGVALFYRIYCKKKFEECKYIFFWEKPLFNSLISFSWWSLFGNTSHVLLTEGINILINLFFGVTVNAARAITVQVENALQNFVKNFMIALNPQITKNYATGNFEEMKVLMERGSKFSFFIFFLLSMPIFIEAEMILKLWLKIVPPYTVIFVRLNLIVILIYTLTNTYLTGIFATGNIKRYQSLIAIMVAVMFSLTLFLIQIGFSPEITYVTYIIISIFVFFFRIISVKQLIGFSIQEYFQKVIIRTFLVFIVSTPCPMFIYYGLQPSFFRLFLVGFSAISITSTSIILLGLNRLERRKFASLVRFKVKDFKYFK